MDTFAEQLIELCNQYAYQYLDENKITWCVLASDFVELLYYMKRLELSRDNWSGQKLVLANHFSLPKVVRVAKSGPGKLNCRNQFCILTMTN